jgi:hypothetical protein
MPYVPGTSVEDLALLAFVVQRTNSVVCIAGPSGARHVVGVFRSQRAARRRTEVGLTAVSSYLFSGLSWFEIVRD